KNHVIVTNNQIEGGVNTQVRALLRAHRGMKLNRHIKTIFWYCYTHSTPTQNPKEYLPTMPTDTDTTQLYRHINEYQQWKTTIPG
ncbi:IS256 family transposase, partial [Scardovia wiggsiae]